MGYSRILGTRSWRRNRCCQLAWVSARCELPHCALTVAHRFQWSTNENGTFVHLPPRGPITPVSSPTLFLVTQDHRATLCYLRHFIPTLKMISISLTQADATTEQQSRSVPEPDNISALKLCSSAAIGLGYNGSHQPLLCKLDLKVHQNPQYLSLHVLMSYPIPLQIQVLIISTLWILPFL